MEELLAVLGSSRTSLGPERGATTISTTAAILEKVPPNRPACPPCVRACVRSRACLCDNWAAELAGRPASLSPAGHCSQKTAPGRMPCA
jgi:hypothetical protein